MIEDLKGYANLKFAKMRWSGSSFSIVGCGKGKVGVEAVMKAKRMQDLEVAVLASPENTSENHLMELLQVNHLKKCGFTD